jgi:hypothetical protein
MASRNFRSRQHVGGPGGWPSGPLRRYTGPVERTIGPVRTCHRASGHGMERSNCGHISVRIHTGPGPGYTRVPSVTGHVRQNRRVSQEWTGADHVRAGRAVPGNARGAPQGGQGADPGRPRRLRTPWMPMLIMRNRVLADSGQGRGPAEAVTPRSYLQTHFVPVSPTRERRGVAPRVGTTSGHSCSRLLQSCVHQHDGPVSVLRTRPGAVRRDVLRDDFVCCWCRMTR